MTAPVKTCGSPRVAAIGRSRANNLADDPSATTTLAKMRDRLQRWMERAQDPLMTGAVVAPAGARVNDANGLSPRELPRTL